MLSKMLRATLARPLNFTFVESTLVQTSGTGTYSNTITIPSSTQAGDLIIVYDNAFDNNAGGAIPTKVVPTDFTEILSTGASTAADRYSRITASYKIATNTDASASLTGQTNVTASTSITPAVRVLLFRPNRVIKSVTANNVQSTITAANPAAVTYALTGVTAPIIVTARSKGLNTYTMTTTTGYTMLSNDVDSGSQPFGYTGYAIFNTSTTSSVTWDMPDTGTTNTQSSFYLTFT